MKYGDYKSIGKTILMLRKSRNWTQADLAKRLNITDKAVSKWESGAGCPEISQLPALAELFGVSIDFIMNGEKKKMKENKPNEDSFYLDGFDNGLKDSLIHNSLQNHLIIMDSLFSSLPPPKEETIVQDLKNTLKTGRILFKEILDEYPIHYYEYIKKLLSEKQYNKIYEFAVDNEWGCLIDAILSAQDEKVEKEAEILIDRPDMLTLSLQETQKRNNFTINDLEENCADKYERIKEQRLKKWIEKVETQIEELTSEKKLKAIFERVNHEISREFLMEQINKDNLEIVAIKLCVKLEACLKFRLKNDEGELLALIDECNALDRDDKELLHRLRMYRNAIAHPDEKDERLTKQELLKCTEIIVELAEGA